jgi:phage baseplate assembly protein W
VKDLGSDMALHPETGDIYADKGGIARVSGLAYLPQKVQTLLSLQQGESPFHPTFGVRFFEYLQTYKQSHWLDRLLRLEVVRQAAIPFEDMLNKRLDTPLRCVTHVRGLEVLSDTPVKQRIPMRIELEVQGLGRWQRDVRVFIPTQEQMEKQTAIRSQWDALLRGTRP